MSPVRMEMEMVLSTTRTKRGRPSKQPAKRGRPRKYPLLSPDELKKPKVWKPLGRPRKYPRVDPPEGASPTPRRSRGRPRKSESKRGAHLRKSLLFTGSSSPSSPSEETPRKRGRPSGTAKGGDGAARKRGRPKGSVNKNKAAYETQADRALPVKRPHHSRAKNDLSMDEEDHQEGEAATTEEEDFDQDGSFGALDGCDLSERAAAAVN